MWFAILLYMGSIRHVNKIKTKIFQKVIDILLIYVYTVYIQDIQYIRDKQFEEVAYENYHI